MVSLYVFHLEKNNFMHYITDDNFSDEVKIKGSSFKSLSYSVENNTQIKNILSKINSEFSDATHICYAYRICNIKQLDLFHNPEIIEYSTDDGEPSGTAGRQILNVLKNKLLVNRLVLVIRYFGGIKLGIKGLIEAYRYSAELVIRDVKLIKWSLLKDLNIKSSYHHHKMIEGLILKYNGEIINSDFSDTIELSIKIPYKNLIKFKNIIIEKSKGTIQIID